MSLPVPISTTKSQTFIAGMVAGLVSRTVTAPMDRLRAKMAAGVPGKPLPGMGELCRNIMKQGGVRAFWQGNGANCMPPAATLRALSTVSSDALVVTLLLSLCSLESHPLLSPLPLTTWFKPDVVSLLPFLCSFIVIHCFRSAATILLHHLLWHI